MLIPFKIQLGGNFVFHLCIVNDFGEFISVPSLESIGDADQRKSLASVVKESHIYLGAEGINFFESTGIEFRMLIGDSLSGVLEHTFSSSWKLSSS